MLVLTLHLLYLAIASARPHFFRQPDERVSPPQLDQRAFTKPSTRRGTDGTDGPAVLARESHGAVARDTAESPSPRVGGGGVTSLIINNRNNMYTVPIQIGTPPQTFEVQLDTGSNGLWVWDASCPAECPSVPGFDRARSSSYVTKNASFQSRYVTTAIAGVVATDDVSVGGYTVAQEIGVTLAANGSGFAGSPVSGILGMGWPGASGAYPSSTPWWHHAHARWAAPVFGIELKRTGAGKLTLGGVDGSAIVGGEAGLTYLPSTGWSVDMDDLVVAGSRLGRGRATLDSGTSGIMGPLGAVCSIYSNIPGAFRDGSVSTNGTLEYYRYPCDSAPDVEIVFAGTAYELHKDDMWIYRNRHNASSREETCVGNVFGWNYDEWVVGAAFFHGVYLAFRYDPPSVGIGKLVADQLA